MNEYVISNLEQQYKLDPSSRKVFLKLAEELRKGGAYQRAVEVCEQGLIHHSSALPGWVCLGRCRQEMNDHAAAEKAYQTVLSLAPDNARALDGLGFIYSEAGRLADALRCYETLYLHSNDETVLARVEDIKARLAAAENEDLITEEVDVDSLIPEADFDDLGDFDDMDAFDDEDLAAVTDDFDLGVEFADDIESADDDISADTIRVENLETVSDTVEVGDIEELDDLDLMDEPEEATPGAAYAFEANSDDMNFSPDETLEITPEEDGADDDQLLEAPEEDEISLETVPVSEVHMAITSAASVVNPVETSSTVYDEDDDVLEAPNDPDEVESEPILTDPEPPPADEPGAGSEPEEESPDSKDEIYLEFERAVDADEATTDSTEVIADSVNVNDAIYREFEMAVLDDGQVVQEPDNSELNEVIQALIIGPQVAYDRKLDEFEGSADDFLAVGVRHEKLDHYEVALSIYKGLWEKTELEAAREHMERVRYRMAAESKNAKKIRYLSNWLDKVKGVYYV